MVVSNPNGDAPVNLVADNANDPQSLVALHCIFCPGGVDVTSYQYCAENPTTTTPTTTTETTTTETTSTTTASSSSSSTSSED